MTIHINTGKVNRNIKIGDVVKLARCLTINIEKANFDDIEYIVGIINGVSNKEDFLNIKLGTDFYSTNIIFLRSNPKSYFYNRFEDAVFNEYTYNIDESNGIYFSVI